MTWEQFELSFDSNYWVNKARRPKTTAALRKVVPQVPEQVFARAIVVFAPDAHENAREFSGGDALFAYLGPHLENQPQAEVDCHVALAFAAFALNPANLAAPGEDEIAALAASWGFPTIAGNQCSSVVCEALEAAILWMVQQAPATAWANSVREKLDAALSAQMCASETPKTA